MSSRLVPCPYCKAATKLVDSIAVYRESYGLIWLCSPCRAWVGVHRGSEDGRPLGTPANSTLRNLRKWVHAVFDPYWKSLVAQGLSKGKARKRAYQRLAEGLGIDASDCHVGMFDEERCEDALKVCRTWQEAATEVAASTTGSKRD